MKLACINQFIIIAVLCVILVISFFLFQSSKEEDETQVIFKTNQGDITFHCSIADTAQERRHGLLDVSMLTEDQGMLFVYDSAESRVFTMKDMSIPLDIIFINENFVISNIVNADIDQENISSNGPVKYVVEINHGLTDYYSILNGTSVRIDMYQ